MWHACTNRYETIYTTKKTDENTVKRSLQGFGQQKTVLSSLGEHRGVQKRPQSTKIYMYLQYLQKKSRRSWIQKVSCAMPQSSFCQAQGIGPHHTVYTSRVWTHWPALSAYTGHRSFVQLKLNVKRNVRCCLIADIFKIHVKFSVLAAVPVCLEVF